MLRRFAKRVVRKISGGESGESPSNRPAPAVYEEPEAEAETLATIEAGCQEIKERIDAGEPVQVLDVREPEETAQGVIEGAILIPLSQLEQEWTQVKDCNEIVCYCAKGGRSLQAATFLRQKGVFNATSLEGGVGAWSELGGSLVKPG
jgi:rhodanese-related sulfurtransferase